MIDHIDPATCPADTPFWVRVPDIDRDVIGQRTDPDDGRPWLVPNRGWHPDHKVTVLRPVDEPMTNWEAVRHARQILIDNRYKPDYWLAMRLDDEAAHLEAEHKAAQEKADADAKREALIEKVIAATNGDIGRVYANAILDAVLAEAATEK